MSAAQAAAQLKAVCAGRAFAYNLKLMDLLPVKEVKVSFSPFHGNVGSARDFLFALSTPSIRQTNRKVVVKADIRSDKSFPTVAVNFANGKKALFKTENLDSVELTREFNKLCQVFMPEKKADEFDLAASMKMGKKRKK